MRKDLSKLKKRKSKREKLTPALFEFTKSLRTPHTKTSKDSLLTNTEQSEFTSQKTSKQIKMEPRFSLNRSDTKTLLLRISIPKRMPSECFRTETKCLFKMCWSWWSLQKLQDPEKARLREEDPSSSQTADDRISINSPKRSFSH